MPTISRFYGIVIFMNYRDHNPPHFHARYQEYEITVGIENGVVTGTMPRSALKLIFEWCETYEKELIDNWGRARNNEPLQSIPPLR